LYSTRPLAQHLLRHGDIRTSRGCEAKRSKFNRIKKFLKKLFLKMSPRDDVRLLLWETVPIFHYFQKLVSWDHSVNEDKWCNRFGIKHLDAFLPLRVHTGNINYADGDVENFPATFLSIFILFVSTTCSISESSILVNIEGKFFDESNISF